MDQAIGEGVSDLNDDALIQDKGARRKYLEDKLWRPVYREYEYDPKGHW